MSDIIVAVLTVVDGVPRPPKQAVVMKEAVDVAGAAPASDATVVRCSRRPLPPTDDAMMDEFQRYYQASR